MEEENAGTEYGSWVNLVDEGALSAAHSAVEALGSYASDYDTDGLTGAYRAAISAALPDRVSMSGDTFFGPYHVRAGEWDGYPTTADGALDIKAIVNGIDFWRLARAYEYGATLYVTIEAGGVDGTNPPVWQLVTDVERVDQEDDLAQTAHELAESVAATQEVATGDLWRVRVWAEPEEGDNPNVAPLAEHVHDTLPERVTGDVESAVLAWVLQAPDNNVTVSPDDALTLVEVACPTEMDIDAEGRLVATVTVPAGGYLVRVEQDGGRQFYHVTVQGLESARDQFAEYVQNLS